MKTVISAKCERARSYLDATEAFSVIATVAGRKGPTVEVFPRIGNPGRHETPEEFCARRFFPGARIPG